MTGSGSRDRDDIPVRGVLEQEHRDVPIRLEERADPELHPLLSGRDALTPIRSGALPALPVERSSVLCWSSLTVSVGRPSPSSASW